MVSTPSGLRQWSHCWSLVLLASRQGKARKRLERESKESKDSFYCYYLTCMLVTIKKRAVEQCCMESRPGCRLGKNYSV